VPVTCSADALLVWHILDFEHGGDMFLRNVVDFQELTLCYVPEDIILQ
jgi:hypothetical protein